MAGFCLCLFLIVATLLCMRGLSFLTRDGLHAPVVEVQSPTLWTGGEFLVAGFVYFDWAGASVCGAPLHCDAGASHRGDFSVEAQALGAPA